MIMRKYFLAKLAASNLRKNKESYFPWLVTCILTAAMFYIMVSLFLNPNLKEMVGGDILAYMLLLGSCVVGIFAFIFLFYTYSFLLKRRKKEFGVFNILGLEKKHISIVLMWEMFYAACISLAGGLAAGIALDKVMFLLITRMLDAEIVLGFFLSPVAVGITVVLFSMIFLSIYLYTVHQIRTADPVELLRAGSTGEREPKAKWFLAVLGLGCLAAGYYIALTVENPIASMLLFFVAVVLVMAGTYLLFTAGSIVLLKMLRKNKRYYYQTRHFTSISGMMYRMKQNAVGLANICILSTGLLLMISSGTSLMFGMEDILQNRYPTEFAVYAREESENSTQEIFDEVRRMQKERGLSVTKEMQYTYLDFTVNCKEDEFYVDQSASLASIGSVSSLVFLPLSDYNAVMGEKKTLKQGEVLVYSNRGTYGYPVMKVLGREYSVVEELDDFVGNGILAANISGTYFVIAPDMEEIRRLCERKKKELGGRGIQTFYGFDTDADEETQNEFYKELYEWYHAKGYQGMVESKAESRQSFYGLYGGLFFLGVFLGALFVMATVLIIYYKQVSEGYEDQVRFEIMQKVGMSRQEVKVSIRSQVLMVFFLPLCVAGIHMTAAFPMMSRLLAVMNLDNLGLYMRCTGVCFLVFAVMYVLIYLLTAKTYYRIVKR